MNPLSPREEIATRLLVSRINSGSAGSHIWSDDTSLSTAPRESFVESALAIADLLLKKTRPKE